MNNPRFPLSDEQRVVVENLTDHLLLLAGAGTGKTTVLACRAANLLTQGTKPEEILCLTFTNRACREMSERILSLAGDDAKQITIRTIHSFCAWLLRSTPTALTDIGSDFLICDTSDAREIVREVTFEVTGRELSDRPAQTLQSFIELCKDSQLSHPVGGLSGAVASVFLHRRAEVERICLNERWQLDDKFFAFLSKYGASIVRLYNEKLLSRNTLDFSDLLLRADALLTEYHTRILWEQRFRYVHVDEVQDVSVAEYCLLQKLCGRAVTLFCGDFNQTIYQWRGSNPDALRARFASDFRPKTIAFTKNYRSSAELLGVAQNFLHNAFGLGAPSGIALADCTDIRTASFDTAAEEAAWIEQELHALGLDDYSRAAVITRTNRACSELCTLLAERGSDIPFMLADECRLFSRTECRDALAALRILLSPHDAQGLRRALLHFVPGIGAATVNGITQEYKRGLGVALPDFAASETHQFGDYFAPLLTALGEGKVVVFDVESTGTNVYADEIIQMAAIRLAPDGSEAERFERFLRPDCPVGDSELVHGFTDAFLAEHGMPPAEALTEFLAFTEGCVIVGHNVGFDMTITGENLRRQCITTPFENLWYDTLDLSRRFLKDLPNHKLSTVSEAVGTAHKPSHDAMDDILATAEVLVHLVNAMLIPATGERRACYAKYLSRFAALAAQLDALRAEIAALPLPDAIARACEGFGLAKDFAGDPALAASYRLLIEYAADCADPKKPLAAQAATLFELGALTAGEFAQRAREKGKAAVITAHQSKGCEFDYVFLPVLQDGVFPSAQAVRSGELSEEQRVFYVSLTRAKKRLWLSHARFTVNHFPAKPSRFLQML